MGRWKRFAKVIGVAKDNGGIEMKRIVWCSHHSRTGYLFRGSALPPSHRPIEEIFENVF
jgi:hypothetical protein